MLLFARHQILLVWRGRNYCVEDKWTEFGRESGGIQEKNMYSTVQISNESEFPRNLMKSSEKQ